jgi:hypothetical protein
MLDHRYVQNRSLPRSGLAVEVAGDLHILMPGYNDELGRSGQPFVKLRSGKTGVR